MIARIIPRTLKCLRVLKIASIINTLKVTFSFNKEIKQDHIQKSQEDRIYMQEQQTAKWTDNYEDIVSDYPFYSIPIGIIRNPSKFSFKDDQLLNLIAFKAINSRQEDVELARNILFPKADPRQLELLGGRGVFTRHMDQYFVPIIQSLNKGSGSLNQRITSLIILNNAYEDIVQTENVKKINGEAIINQDQSGILLAYYVQLLIRHNLDYTKYLQTILTKLEDNNLSPKFRLKIAKSIFTTPHFQACYSRKMLDAAIAAIGQNIGDVHNYQLLFILRNIYNYHSPQSKKFANALQNHLIEKHIDDNNVDYHIPLILKTIRYCYRLNISTQALVLFIANNMKRFQVIFDRKRISKGVFFNLLFSKTGKQISPELVGHLKKYFLDGISHFVQSQQAQSGEILRLSKLLIKYFHYFSEKEQQYIKQKYLQKTIPYFSNSNQVLFYSLLVYLRVKKPQQTQQMSSTEFKQQQTIKKYIQMFLLRCCNKNIQQEFVIHSNINEVIEIVYQIYRHGIKFNKYEMPHICQYEYRQKQTLKPEIMNYFFYCLVKNQHEKKETIKNCLQKIKPLLQTFIRKNRLNSFKTILCIIDVCDRVGFQDNFFYKAVQNAFSTFLWKNPKFVIPEKDLKFINQKMIKRGYGSLGLKNLIVESLKKPRNWQSLRRSYVDNERQFKQKLDRKRKEGRQIRESQ